MDRPTGNFESPIYRRFAYRMTAFPVVHASSALGPASNKPAPLSKSLKGIIAGQYFLYDALVSYTLSALSTQLKPTYLCECHCFVYVST